METHAHHLHKAPGKKWTHYLFEFLMLFLAVFCGFLAENFREHRVEKERGRQYALSFYEDLKEDTVRENYIIQFDEEKISWLNSMSACYDTIFKNLGTPSCLIELIQSSRNNRSFSITDRTLRQLANAGGFRILNKEDADSILAYEKLFKNYQNFESTVFQEAQDNVRNTLNQLANFKVNEALQRSVLVQGRDTTRIIQQEPLLFSNDKILLNRWFNELLLYFRVTNSQRNLLSELRNEASGLIKFFKNKYHLE
jgi:hypothetical protein